MQPKLPTAIMSAFFSVWFVVAVLAFYESGVPWIDVYAPGVSDHHHQKRAQWIPFARVFLTVAFLGTAIFLLRVGRRRGRSVWLISVAYGAGLGWVAALVALASQLRAGQMGVPTGTDFLLALLQLSILSFGWLFGALVCSTGLLIHGVLAGVGLNSDQQHPD